jgi:transposase
MQPGMSISYVAPLRRLTPSLVFRWKRLMTEGGHQAVHADDEVVPASGRKTLEVEIPKEPWSRLYRNRPPGGKSKARPSA